MNIGYLFAILLGSLTATVVNGTPSAPDIQAICRDQTPADYQAFPTTWIAAPSAGFQHLSEVSAFTLLDGNVLVA